MTFTTNFDALSKWHESLGHNFSIHYRLFGCQDFIGSPGEESNFYDAENQSISNHARLAVKRASFWKVLKNGIRFYNSVLHHLQLKQFCGNFSWFSKVILDIIFFNLLFLVFSFAFKRQGYKIKTDLNQLSDNLNETSIQNAFDF